MAGLACERSSLPPKTRTRRPSHGSPQLLPAYPVQATAVPTPWEYVVENVKAPCFWWKRAPPRRPNPAEGPDRPSRDSIITMAASEATLSLDETPSSTFPPTAASRSLSWAPSGTRASSASSTAQGKVLSEVGKLLQADQFRGGSGGVVCGGAARHSRWSAGGPGRGQHLRGRRGSLEGRRAEEAHRPARVYSLGRRSFSPSAPCAPGTRAVPEMADPARRGRQRHLDARSCSKTWKNSHSRADAHPEGPLRARGRRTA